MGPGRRPGHDERHAPRGPGHHDEYGPWGAQAHRIVQKAYAAGRYFGPVNAYGPDWEALGMSKWEGGMAAGGPVSAGSAYMVGEKGPELFVPPSSGAIVPNGAGGHGERTCSTSTAPARTSRASSCPNSLA